MGYGAGFDFPGPPGKSGDPHVPFIFRTKLMPPQWATVGFTRSSVVIGEKHEGVFLDAIFSYAVEDPTRTGIDLTNQGLHEVVFGLG